MVDHVRGAVRLLVYAAICGAGAAWSASSSHTVAIENMQFSPSTLTVKRGERVVWMNRDLVRHTATAAKVFDSGPLEPNVSWSYVARKAGRFDYVCTLHPTMKATLIVE